MSGEYKRQYRVAKLVGGLIAFVGWAVIILGLVGVAIAVISGLESRGMEQQILLAAAAFSFLFSLIGLLLAGAGQLIRATADNANYNGEMLALMKAGNST